MAKLLPLPATNTPRFRIHYTTANLQHTICLHQAPTVDAAGAVTNATALINLLKQALYAGSVFTLIDYAPTGSDIFNPAATVNIAGSVAGALPAQDAPISASWTGRSLSGRKTKFLLFGAALPNDVNWRYEPTENTAIANIITGLNNGVGDIRTIDGLLPAWHPYANISANRHWVRRARQGAG